MSRGINKAILIGNLGDDPEVKVVGDSTTVTNLSLATSDAWTNKNGERQEKTEWHRVSFFGKAAEILGEHAKKGAKLYVEGSIETRKWQDKDGNDRYTTSIKGRDFQFLSPRNEPQDSPSESPETDDDLPF